MTLSGAIAGWGLAPGANRNSGGDTADSLRTALRQALGDLDPALVINGVFGIAGAGAAGRPAAVKAAGEAWASCGLSGSPTVVTDIAVAFAAGTTAPSGIVVMAGTGACAAAIGDGEIIRRADGYGFLVGDEGSAVWIGKEAVRAALQAFDGRGKPTLLAESVPRAMLGAQFDRALLPPGSVPSLSSSPPPPPSLPPQSSPPTGSLPPTPPRPREAPLDATKVDISPHSDNQARGGVITRSRRETVTSPTVAGRELPGLSRGALTQAIVKEVYGIQPAALGKLGPVVCAAAMAGDEVARRITDEAAEWLLLDVDAVRTAADVSAPVVMAGSVLGSGPVADAVRAGLRERFAAEPTVAGEGAVGAAGMALRAMGL
jgi:N-acetylglucosamine kinase-like BadF-type ATPase